MLQSSHMSYFNSYEFYKNLETFMNNQFYDVRKAFIYDFLLPSDKKKLDEIICLNFAKEFMLFIQKVKMYYKAEKIDFFFKKSLSELKAKWLIPTCKIITKNKQNSVQNKILEDKIKKKLQVNNLFFEYCIDKSILGGLKIFYNYKMYDLTLNNLLYSIKKDMIKKVQE